MSAVAFHGGRSVCAAAHAAPRRGYTRGPARLRLSPYTTAAEPPPFLRGSEPAERTGRTT
ncbi:hypothetical protein PSMK_29900 [Phycisphaera mikurensis NBRC 102666]|uniref:Uncharacterized protein n=1 Tax=Phycisphaera mikurensis (strain NBRC 102666 / KCTC 22515 / FYK2301M01) TaxID=1142394 RepID=I0IIR1_PHYMF|nr:hypothetical protein PSMK_29900 [Phycisphaera mikurensis NBRC 102666]